MEDRDQEQRKTKVGHDRRGDALKYALAKKWHPFDIFYFGCLLLKHDSACQVYVK